MNNPEIAKVFENIAKLLEVQGELPFKIRAYQRVAQEIKHLPEEIQAFAQAGELRTIPGVGQEIEKKIQEMLATGRLAYYERLLGEFPPGFPEVLELPGVGPKLAARLWKELGISNLTDLEAALRSGQIADLPRVSARTAEALLQEVTALQESTRSKTAAS